MNDREMLIRLFGAINEHLEYTELPGRRYWLGKTMMDVATYLGQGRNFVSPRLAADFPADYQSSEEARRLWGKGEGQNDN